MAGSGIFADLVDPTPAPAPDPAPAPQPVVTPPPVDPGPPSNIFADLVATPVTSRDGDRSYGEIDDPNGRTEPDIGSRIGNTKAFEVASNLAPWFMGPVGIVAAAGGDAVDRYQDMRAKGHGIAASATGGAAQAAVDLAVPKVAQEGAQAIRAGLRIAPAVTRIGAAAEHAAGGAATGVLLPEGSAAISAASGDPERAKAEMRSIGESGAIGAALGAGHGVVAGGHAPTGVFSDLVEPSNAGRGRAGVVDAPVAARDAAPPAVAGEAPAAPSGVAPAAAVVAPGDAHAPAERAAVGGTVPAETGAPQPATAGAPVGMFADLVTPTRTPVAEGQPLDSIESLRNRAAANARGELGQPKPSADTLTPITGSPVLPEGTDHGPREQAPAAAAHVQGAPGESAAPAREGGAVEEAGRVREQAPAQAEEARPVLVDRSHDVPLFGGTSEDGRTVYIDRNAPRTVDVNGKPADVDKYTAIHERAEKPLLDQGMSYADAHDHANAVENAALRADGHDPAAYNAALKAHIDAAAAKPEPRVPPDIERKPYNESGVALPPKESPHAAPRESQPAATAPAPVADERTAAAPADVASAANEAPAAKRAAVGRTHGDILDAMIEEGGIEPRPKDLPFGAGEHDARPKLTGKARAAYSGIVPPDLMAQRLEGRGYGDGTVNTMHRLAREAQETRQAAPGQHADDVMAHDSSAPPEANQRATSLRPDLAIPTTDIQTREAYKQVRDEARGTERPEVRSRESQREAANERMANDPEGEAKRAIEKVNRGDALNEQEQHVLLAEAQMHLRAGNVEEFARHMLAYDRAGTEAARTFGARSDPAEPPAKRAQSEVLARLADPDKATQQAMDAALKAKNKAEYKRLADAHVAKVRQHLIDVAKKSGIDPMDLAGEKAPKRTAKEKVAKATVEVRREFGDLLKQLKESLRKPTSTGAFGGEQADLIAKIIANRIKAGLLKAADVALDIAKAIPRLRRDPAMQQAFADAWKQNTGEAVDREALFGKVEPKPPKPPPTLDEQVASAQDKLNAAIERHHAAMGQTPAERLAAIEAKAKARQDAKDAVHPEVRALLDQRKALDSAVRARDRLVYRNARRVLDASRTLKSDPWDKFDEAYRSGLHTSLGLPWYKIGADLVNKVHSFIADDIGAAIINYIPGGSDPRSLADAPHILKAILPSMVRGAQHGLESLREDRNVWADEVRAARAAKEGMTVEGLGQPDEFHQQAHALGPVLHNALGWNMRLIGAEQSGIESLFAHMQVAAEAHRLAVGPDGQRLSGQALEDHMRAQVEDLASPAWTNAVATAERDTSVAKPSVLNPVYWVNKVKNANLRDNKAIMETPGAFPVLRTAQSALRMVAPFTTVPTNIVTRGIYGMTPLNGLTIAARTARAGLHLVGAPGGKAYARAQFNTDLSRHVLGWLVAAGISYAMYDKDGKRRLTGYTYNKGGADRGEAPEHSALIGGKWWDYGKILGSGAHAVGMLADAFDAARSTVVPGAKVSPGNALAGWLKTAKDHLVGESFMRGVSDLTAAVGSEGSAAKYAGTLAGSFVPTEFHQASKALDNVAPSHRAKEPGMLARAAQVFRQQLGIHETPAVDVFGKEIPKDDPLSGPVTGPLARLLSPIHGKTADLGDDAQPYRNLIMRWNDENPGAKLKFGSPEPVVEIGRKRVPLTPQQYHDLCADAGERTMTLLGRMTLNTDAPTERDAKMLENAVKSGQEGARGAMKMRVMRETKPSD